MIICALISVLEQQQDQPMPALEPRFGQSALQADKTFQTDIWNNFLSKEALPLYVSGHISCVA
jgi:hypothetical protein